MHLKLFILATALLASPLWANEEREENHKKLSEMYHEEGQEFSFYDLIPQGETLNLKGTCIFRHIPPREQTLTVKHSAAKCVGSGEIFNDNDGECHSSEIGLLFNERFGPPVHDYRMVRYGDKSYILERRKNDDESDKKEGFMWTISWTPYCYYPILEEK